MKNINWPNVKIYIMIVIENDENFRFSKIKQPYSFDNDYFGIGHVPLENKDIQIIYGNL